MFPGQHKVSDIYFVALLKPLSFDIVKEDAEIQEARWMKVRSCVSRYQSGAARAVHEQSQRQHREQSYCKGNIDIVISLW